MKILVTVTHKDILYYELSEFKNIKSVKIPSIDDSIIHKYKSKPFGVDIFNDEIYVISHNNLHKFDIDNNHISTTKLLIPENSHQLKFINNKLHITSPIINSIIKFDEKKIYYDLLNLSWVVDEPRPPDILHVNSLFVYNDFVYVNIHNNGYKSYILKCDLDFKYIDKFSIGGKCSHSVVVNNDVYVLDTYNCRLLCSNGRNLDIRNGMFLRGLIVTDNLILIGASCFDKHDRYKDSLILIIDKQSYRIINNIVLNGDINDMMLCL